MSHDHAALYGARPGEAGLVSWRKTRRAFRRAQARPRRAGGGS